MESLPEHELAYLLDFDDTQFLFEEGYWVKLEVRRTDPTPQRPHGLSYSFTLHDPDGQRLLGFDNAHSVPPLGGRYIRPSQSLTTTGIGMKRTKVGRTSSSRPLTWFRTS
jgi:hypothetical protein